MPVPWHCFIQVLQYEADHVPPDFFGTGFLVGDGGFGGFGFLTCLVIEVLTDLPGHFLIAAFAASTDALYLAYSAFITLL